MNQTIKRFLVLEIDVKSFLFIAKTDESLCAELNGCLPSEMDVSEAKWVSFPYLLLIKTHGRDVLTIFEKSFHNGTTPYGRSGIYEFVYFITNAIHEGIPFSSYYRDRFKLLMGALPDYVGGKEAEKYIDSLIDGLPSDISQKERQALVKRMIKEKFTCKGTAHPKWVQEAEWPVDGEPLTYLRRKKDGDKYTYFFENSISGDVTEIIQYA